jgi:hypothetical protein
MLLRHTIALFLLLSFLTQAFSRYFIVAGYYVDTSAYIENCINKDKPWMHCNGKCQLCKKLHQQDNSDKQNSERRSGDDRNDPLSSSAAVDFIALNPATSLSAKYPRATGAAIVKRPRTQFHPPDLSSV